MTKSDEGFLLLMLLAVVAVALYVVPSWIAYSRNHHQRGAILVLNLAFGWTVLGWVGALIWASTAVETRPDLRPDARRVSAPCRACKMEIHPEATICPYCRTERPFAPPAAVAVPLSEGQKACPSCRAPIHARAAICPHCGSRVVEA